MWAGARKTSSLSSLHSGLGLKYSQMLVLGRGVRVGGEERNDREYSTFLALVRAGDEEASLLWQYIAHFTGGQRATDVAK